MVVGAMLSLAGPSSVFVDMSTASLGYDILELPQEVRLQRPSYNGSGASMKVEW